MSAARTRLPPLNLLRAFDAAGRHMSFKAAADELNVSASTISHQIKSLESYLGIELFQRGVRQVRLTSEGQAYLEHVSRGFASLRAGGQMLRERLERPQLRVSANPYMAAEILIPLIPAFRADFPGVGLSIEASESISTRLEDDVHYALRFGSGQWTGMAAQRLFDATAVVVCPPGQSPGSCDMGEMGRWPQVDYVYRGSSVWAHWRQLSGMEVSEHSHPGSVQVENFHAAMLAVRNGAGISIGLLPLVQPWLAAGSLTELADTRVRLEEGLYLVWSAGRDPEQLFSGVRAWLTAQLTSLNS